MTTTELKQLLGSAISGMQESEFASSEQLKVVFPPVLSDYTPLHPAGEYLVVFHSAQYGKSKSKNSVMQDKEVRFSVYTVVKYTDQGISPETYTDFLEKALSGIRLPVNRADKLVYAESVKFLKEKNRYWWYETVFVCPAVLIKEAAEIF
jgi:hypothetical protein